MARICMIALRDIGTIVRLRRVVFERDDARCRGHSRLVHRLVLDQPAVVRAARTGRERVSGPPVAGALHRAPRNRGRCPARHTHAGTGGPGLKWVPPRSVVAWRGHCRGAWLDSAPERGCHCSHEVHVRWAGPPAGRVWFVHMCGW